MAAAVRSKVDYLLQGEGTCVRLQPELDDRLIVMATASFDGTTAELMLVALTGAELEETDTVQEVSLPGIPGKLTDVQWSPGSGAVYAASTTGAIVVVPVRDLSMGDVASAHVSSAPLARMDVRREHMRHERLVAVDEGGIVHLLDPQADMAEVATSPAPACPLHDVCFMPSLLDCITAGCDPAGQLLGWSFDTSALSPSIRIIDPTPNTSYRCLAPHPRNKHVVMAGSTEGEVVAWDLRNVAQPLQRSKLHQGAVWRMRTVPMEDAGGRAALLTCGNDGQVLRAAFPDPPATLPVGASPLMDSFAPFVDLDVHAQTKCTVALDETGAVKLMRE